MRNLSKLLDKVYTFLPCLQVEGMFMYWCVCVYLLFWLVGKYNYNKGMLRKPLSKKDLKEMPFSD